MMIPTSPGFAEDWSLTYSLLEEIMKEPTTTTTKRRRQEEEEGNMKKMTTTPAAAAAAPKKKQVLKQQEKLLESSDEIQQLIKTNHGQKTQTMIDLQDASTSANKGLSTKEAEIQGGGKQKRVGVGDRSTALWDQCSHPDFPEADFRKEFRMSKETFNMICDELSEHVEKADTILKPAIPVKQKVAACIWRLATGAAYTHVSKQFRIAKSTCQQHVLEVCSAIQTVLMPNYLQWPDEEKLKSFKKEFQSVSRIPNVVGSMYTTHIRIIEPSKSVPSTSVSAYINNRHTQRSNMLSYSITLQGVVDPKGVFTDVCAGWPGSMPDDQVLEKSALYQIANGGELKGSWIVGSTGFRLMDWVMVPYTQQNLTLSQHAFNEEIGKVQRVGKSAFARLKGRWGCLLKREETKLQDLPVVVGACCVLHNICEMRNEEMDPDPDVKFELFDDEMVPKNISTSMSAIKTRDSIAQLL